MSVSAVPDFNEESFDWNGKPTRLGMPSPAVIGGYRADIERRNTAKATDRLVSLDEEGQAEGS